MDTIKLTREWIFSCGMRLEKPSVETESPRHPGLPVQGECSFPTSVEATSVTTQPGPCREDPPRTSGLTQRRGPMRVRSVGKPLLSLQGSRGISRLTDERLRSSCFGLLSHWDHRHVPCTSSAASFCQSRAVCLPSWPFPRKPQCKPGLPLIPASAS